MAVAFADEGGVEESATVEIDEAQEPAEGVHGVAGRIQGEFDRLAVEPDPGEGRGYPPEMFHGFGGVYRFGRADSDEADGRTLARIVVCVKFCKKYFRKIQFSSVDRRRACGNVGKLSVLGEAFPSLRGNPCLLADFL